jgi:hypothetical protein
VLVSLGELTACLIDHQRVDTYYHLLSSESPSDGERVYLVVPVLILGGHTHVTLVEK